MSNIDIVIIVLILVLIIKWFKLKLKENDNTFNNFNKSIVNISNINKKLISNNHLLNSKVEELEKQKYQNLQKQKDLDKELLERLVEGYIKTKIRELDYQISTKYLTEKEILRLMRKELSSEETSGSLDIKFTKLFAENIKPQMEKYIEIRLSNSSNNDNFNKDNISNNEVKKEKIMKPRFK